MAIVVDRTRLSTASATALAMLAALALAPAAAGAQDAAIDGTVIDATGLVLPGVTVEARNQASGDVEMFDIHSALVLWHDALRAVPVHRAEGTPLIGMSLLSGSRLIVDSWEGGDVVIEEVANAGQD